MSVKLGNRKAAEKFILQFMEDIEPTGYNKAEMIDKVFPSMSDKDFDIYMQGLRDKTKTIVLFKPMYQAKGITLENNFKVAKKYGLSYFEKLNFTGNADEPDYQTPIEYMVLDLPYRRQSQTLVKKISVPDNNKIVDQLTFQPTGESKGSKISYPELQVLIGMGLDKSIEELTAFRAGDRGGFRAYNAMIMRYGTVSMRAIDSYKTGVESTKTLKVYLTSMHISTTM